MKNEIPVDRAAACARAPRASPRMTLTLTMHHFSNGMGRRVRGGSGFAGGQAS